MSFLHIEFLYTVLPILLILFGFILTQKHSYQHYFSEEVMQRLQVTANTMTLQARNMLFFLSAFFMVIAMSGPVIDNGMIEVKSKSADVMIALDISDSMLAEDIYPNRLKRAKQKAMEFIELSKKERIGVIAFAKNSYLVSPLSFDTHAVNFLLSKLSTDSITEQGTNFLSLLKTVDTKLKNQKQRYLFILTDGGDEKDFSKEIAFAKAHNIVVFVLGIATQKGAPIKKEDGTFVKYKGKIIISKLNGAIAELASKSGGVYIESVNADADIKRMHQEIESRAKQKELKSKMIQQYIPLFYYPLGIALLLLLIATSSMSKREKVEVPSAFILALLFTLTPKAQAGIFDFELIDKAQQAYEKGEYKKAQSFYRKLSKDDPALHYNLANSYYKAKNYKAAIAEYKQTYFKSRAENAKKYANLGNSYVKEGAKDALKNAKDAYERSLKLEEDKDVRENLQAVIEAMKQQQQKQQKQNQQQQQNKKDQQKNKQQNKQQKEKNQQHNKNKEQNKQEGEKQQGKDQQQQDHKQQQDSKQKQQERENSKQQRNEKQNSKQDHQKQQQNKQDQTPQKEQEQKAKDTKKKQKQKDQLHKQEQKQLEQLKEKKTKEDKQEKQQGATMAQDAKKMQQMSDEEQAKWLKALNKKQGTYLYMLNKQPIQKEITDEKPW